MQIQQIISSSQRAYKKRIMATTRQAKGDKSNLIQQKYTKNNNNNTKKKYPNLFNSDNNYSLSINHAWIIMKHYAHKKKLGGDAN